MRGFRAEGLGFRFHIGVTIKFFCSPSSHHSLAQLQALTLLFNLPSSPKSAVCVVSGLRVQGFGFGYHGTGGFKRKHKDMHAQLCLCIRKSMYVCIYICIYTKCPRPDHDQDQHHAARALGFMAVGLWGGGAGGGGQV